MGDLRIGISGWRYAGWRGVFYPADLPQRRELEYASRKLNSIEINGSFYSLQRPDSYRRWYAEVPDDFVFAVKGGRFITHMKKLRNVETALANFFASGVLLLEEKLGPILWQLPPMLSFESERLRDFFDRLPRDTKQAVALARQHDDKVAGRAYCDTKALRPLRHALEVRHESFRTQRFVELLREHDIALVVADTAKRWPLLEDVTADFVYVRLHGDEELYASGYSSRAIQFWGRRVRQWACGGEPAEARCAGDARAPRRARRDVYVYFDNDAKVHAPFDALALAANVCGQKPDLCHPGHGGEPLRTEWPAMTRRGRRQTGT